MIENAIILLVAYVCSVAGTTAWIFGSGQSYVPRTGRMVKMVAARFALVYAVAFLGCAAGNVAARVPLAVAAVLLLALLLADPIFGLAAYAMFYPLQQYILGFPDRGDWILDASPAMEDTPDPLDAHVGRHGTTVAALRPSGEIGIDAERFPAVSEDGGYIDADTAVIVRYVQNGTLIVSAVSD